MANEPIVFPNAEEADSRGFKYLVCKADGTPLPADEPLFIVRAQDWLGPDIVRKYAERLKASFEYRARGLDEAARELLRVSIDSDVAEIEELAYEMQRWQLGHSDKVKFPD